MSLMLKIIHVLVIIVTHSSGEGSSTWLFVVPLRSHGYHLHKGAFRDALCFRYGWDPPTLPSSCICGSPLTIDHAFNCHCGGFPSLRHNEIRDITASLMKEVCPQVCVEPTLLPFSGEMLQPQSANTEDNARLDIRAEDFWSRQQHAYFDIKVFNPNSSSYQKKQLLYLYRTHERQKRREYEDHITNVEHVSFSPLIFSSFGGMRPTASVVYHRLASPNTTILTAGQHSSSTVKSVVLCYTHLSAASVALVPHLPPYHPTLTSTLPSLW